MKQLNDLQIRMELARLNRNQAWLAEQIGVSRQYLNWMVRNRKVNRRRIRQIASVFGCPEKYLVIG